MASAWSIGATFTRPPLKNALTTPEVIALSTPGSRVRFLRPVRPRRSATGHDVDEAARHHHHLRDAAAVEPRAHLVVGEGLLPDLRLLGPDESGEAAAHAAI